MNGYFVHEDVFNTLDVSGLRDAIDRIPSGEEIRKRDHVYGVRNLLEISSEIRDLAIDHRVRQFVTPILGDDAFAVRAIFFDKVADSNWSLVWHQDNVITVRDRIEIPGFEGWRQKAGVWHCQPPAEILGRMVAVRVHLDDCGLDNGPLRVLSGSHRFGWLNHDQEICKRQFAEVVCCVNSGGVVVMCPLILHSSGRSELATHRRVIHIEYSASDLPNGLEWNIRLSP